MTKQRKGRRPKRVKLKDCSFSVRMRVMASRFKRNNIWWEDQQTLVNLARIVRSEVASG